MDEAGMVSTPQLASLAALADQHGWRVILVGDPRQFSPVGRGGMYHLLVDTHGAIELDQVHRFTNPWEADASLRLRQGDPTIAVVYDQHGRIHGATPTRHNALAAWHEARAAGQSVLLSAPTNETVIDLNRAAQHHRAEQGELNLQARHVTAGPYRLHVGDEIVTRRNDRHLVTDRGEMIRNRDTFTITATHRNGSLVATGPTGTVRLPAGYVADDVELGYAQTSHATQGRTVDRSILVLDGPTDVRGLYVPLTRGRERNDVYIALTGDQTALDVFTESLGRSWIDQPAITRARQVAAPEPVRPGVLDGAALRALFNEQARLADEIHKLRSDLARLPGQHGTTTRQIAGLVARRHAGAANLQKAFDTLDRHDKPLRRGRHQNEINIARRDVTYWRNQLTQLTDDITRQQADLDVIARRLADARHRQPELATLTTRHDTIAQRLDHDAQRRSLITRRQPSVDITDNLGPRPTSREAGRAWDHAAGLLDQHLTAWPHPERSPGYQASADRTTNAMRHLDTTLNPPSQQRHQQRDIDGPDIGIDM